jgi:hypothetical protein
VGVLTKLSGLTIIDVDDPELVEDMEQRFGFSPLVSVTPSNGVHLCYRADGERCRNLRRSEGLAVDVKAGGANKGGFIVVPPSVRPSGPHAGKHYSFIRGGWDDIARLPTIRAGSLPSTPSEAHGKGSLAEPFHPAAMPDAARAGDRNNTLFGLLMREARNCTSEAQMMCAAAEINSMFEPPLPKDEVVRTARSVWGYREKNELWVAGPARVIVTAEDLVACQGNSDAFMLHAHLKMNHAARIEPFAISDKAMAQAGVIQGWGRARYRAARDALLSMGRLTQLHKGGNGARDASRYVLEKGSVKSTQYNQTPSSPSSLSSSNSIGIAASAATGHIDLLDGDGTT